MVYRAFLIIPNCVITKAKTLRKVKVPELEKGLKPNCLEQKQCRGSKMIIFSDPDPNPTFQSFSS
jgi:hypothetical protein